MQPIVRLRDGEVIGFEGLSRMPTSSLSTEQWFELAHATGMRTELELGALAAIARIGAPPDRQLLFVNLSPGTLPSVPREIFGSVPIDRVVIELTEREPVHDYDELRGWLEPWVAAGARVAVDDAGSGYASLEHVVQLRPDFLKLSHGLIADIDRDPTKQALLRAVVAFAREIGSQVVAEGVERIEELDVLVASDVDYAQGYFLARPGDPWPEVAPRSLSSSAPDDSMLRLARSLAAVRDATQASNVVCDHLVRRGVLLPSVYLARGGRLRCQASRGYWQVFDGFPSEVGVLGRTFRTGVPCFVPDVSSERGFVDAIPGVVSEICVPMRAHGEVIGAVNVESPLPMTHEIFDEVQRVAGLLAGRIGALGVPRESAPQRLARHAAALGGLTTAAAVQELLVHAACDVSGFDSSAIALFDGGCLTVVEATGPLAVALMSLDQETLAATARLVADVTSTYTVGNVTGMGFIGHDVLRRAGAGALAVVPLRAHGQHAGIVMCAHTEVVGLDTNHVELLEMLAGQGASCLQSALATPVGPARRLRDPLAVLGAQPAPSQRAVTPTAS